MVRMACSDWVETSNKLVWNNKSMSDGGRPYNNTHAQNRSWIQMKLKARPRIKANFGQLGEYGSNPSRGLV